MAHSDHGGGFRRTDSGQSVADGVGGSSRPGREIELRQDIGDVPLDGERTHVETLADHLIAQALRDESEHLELALG